MVNNETLKEHSTSRLRLVMAAILVLIIAFSNISEFSILSDFDMDKLEKLAEGENDIDSEEKEKNIEGEEDALLSSNFDRYNSLIDLIHSDLNMIQLRKYHLKIPTPPPDHL